MPEVDEPLEMVSGRDQRRMDFIIGVITGLVLATLIYGAFF